MADRYAFVPKTEAWPNGGEWRPFAGKAVCCCPECGTVVRLAEGHTIDDDGNVSPSLVCPMEGCKFHEWARLEGWANG